MENAHAPRCPLASRMPLRRGDVTFMLLAHEERVRSPADPSKKAVDILSAGSVFCDRSRRMIRAGFSACMIFKRWEIQEHPSTPHKGQACELRSGCLFFVVCRTIKKFNRTTYSKDMRDATLVGCVQFPGEVGIVRAHIEMSMPAQVEENCFLGPFFLRAQSFNNRRLNCMR